MGAVKQAVFDLVRMLNRRQKEAKRLPVTLDRLESYLREKPEEIIRRSLFLLLSRIKGEAAKITRSVVVLISPDWIVSVGESHSDSWLERLKSQGFTILTLEQFGSLIRTLQLEVTQGNYMPAIEVLRANAKIERPFVHLGASPAREVERPRKASTSSERKLSDFLPAPPPYPPLPRGLFKD